MGKLSNYRHNRALRRAEEKALRKKAKIEAKAAARAQAAAEKIRGRVDAKQLKKSTKDAVKAAKQEASTLKKSTEQQAQQGLKAAKKAAKKVQKQSRAEQKMERRHTAGLAALELKKVKEQDKAAYQRLAKEAKLERQQLKATAKDAKAGRAHEAKLAELDLKKIEAGQINKQTAKRYAAFLQVLMPIVAPLALRGMTAAQSGSGVPLAANPTSALQNRIAALRTTIGKLTANRGDDEEIQAFANRTDARLKDLGTALDGAESVPTRERRVIHQSVSDELNRVNRDVMARLGVKA